MEDKTNSTILEPMFSMDDDIQMEMILEEPT
jgi:hypothetical protein